MINNFCPQCGSRVTDQTDRFCRTCGHKYDQPQSLASTPPTTVFPMERLTAMLLQANPSGEDLETAKEMLETCINFARNNPAWDQVGDAGLDDFSQAVFQKICDAYPRAWPIWDSEYMASQVLMKFRLNRR